MAKKALGPPVGSLVFVREQWGNTCGNVDEKNLYKIEKIGPKQCTLQRVTIENKIPSGRRHNITLYIEGDALELRARQDTDSSRYRQLYPYKWHHILVMLGDEGWDPATNY